MQVVQKLNLCLGTERIKKSNSNVKIAVKTPSPKLNFKDTKV